MTQMRAVFQVIEQMKRQRVIEDYAVAGAVGALFYVEPFSTADIDFLVNLPSTGGLLVTLAPIQEWLESKGYQMDKTGSFKVEGWDIQFLPVSDGLSSEAFREAHYLTFDSEMDVRVVKAEHLAAEAVRVGRLKDLQRILLLVESADFDADLFENIVTRFSLEEKWKKVEALLQDL
jgi:hypothetical protein